MSGSKGCHFERTCQYEMILHNSVRNPAHFDSPVWRSRRTYRTPWCAMVKRGTRVAKWVEFEG